MEQIDIPQERRYCSKLGFSVLAIMLWSILWQFGLYWLDGWILPFRIPETLYYLRSYAVIFALGIVGCTPFPANVAKRLAGGAKTAGVFRVLEVCVLVGLLLVCTAFLVDGSFNPFLYFRF